MIEGSRHHRHTELGEIAKISATHRKTRRFSTSLCQVLIAKTCVRDDSLTGKLYMTRQMTIAQPFKHGEHGIIFNGGAVPATLATFSLSDSQALREGDAVSWPITACQHVA